MDAAAEIGRNLISKHEIQPEFGDEQADAGRDCRTRLARPNSQARADREIFIFTVQRTSSRIDNLTRLILLLNVCDHTRQIGTSAQYITNSIILDSTDSTFQTTYQVRTTADDTRNSVHAVQYL